MAFPSAWPPALRTWLHVHGFAGPAAHLGAPGGGGAWRVGVPPDSVVVKTGAPDREVRVYDRTRPALAEAGVDIPALRAAGGDWLVLEDIPLRLPSTRVGADPDVLDRLARLHALPADWWSEAVGKPFRPCWAAGMNAEAVRHAPPEERPALAETLEALRLTAQFSWPARVISGDTNATNWAMREDGSPVLLDWGRAGLGHPAVDLALLLPGTGWDSAAPAQQLGRAYRRHARNGVPDDLERMIERAKAWHVLEFIAGHGPLPDDAMAALWRHVRRVGAMLGSV
jgi:hypothetical protein